MSSGGNRIYRKSYTEIEIVQLVNDYKNNSPLYSPVFKKLCKNYNQWFNSIAYHLDKPSTNLFFFLLQPAHYSKHSGIQLTEREFSYSDRYKGWKGFKKYTIEEIEKKIWHKRADKSKFFTSEHKQKMSNIQKLYWNTDAGIARRRQLSDKMTEYYLTEEGKRKKHEQSVRASARMKNLIAEGKFTPPITNTWTHWKANISINNTIFNFRSSWEACFWLSNQQYEYETVRVKGSKKTYVSDFFDRNTNTLIEIKPTSRYNKEIEKMCALQQHCRDNNYKFIWINERNILNYIDESLFSGSNLEQLHKLKKSCKK